MKKKDQESLRKIVIIGLVLVVGYLGYQSMTSDSSPFSEASGPPYETLYMEKSGGFSNGSSFEDDGAQRQAEEAKQAGTITDIKDYKQCMDSIGDSAYCKAMYFTCSDRINQNSYREKGKRDCEESLGLSCVYRHGRCSSEDHIKEAFCREYSEAGKDVCNFHEDCEWEPSHCIGAESNDYDVQN